ncbi:MAG: hypothetical protein HYX52_03880 [Chloroflexi bacterium]|nr:hypothetical protein [Chloroflexota bacterium]
MPVSCIPGERALDLRIRCAGDVVEWQELLNGTQLVSIEGASEDGAWTLSGGFSWNIGLREGAAEGDVTLSRGDDEMFASLTSADVTDTSDAPEGDHAFRLDYDIDGGAGAFDGATGRIEASGAFTRATFAGEWRVHVDAAS